MPLSLKRNKRKSFKKLSRKSLKEEIEKIHHLLLN